MPEEHITMQSKEGANRPQQETDILPYSTSKVSFADSQHCGNST